MSINCVRLLPHKLIHFNQVMINRTSSTINHFNGRHRFSVPEKISRIPPPINLKQLIVSQKENVKLMTIPAQDILGDKKCPGHGVKRYDLQKVGFTPHNIVLWGSTHKKRENKVSHKRPFLPEIIKDQILLCSPVEKVQTNDEKLSGPTNEQLEIVYITLTEDLPRLFITPQRFVIYRRDLIFENNISGKRYVGLDHYVRTISFLKAIGSIKYAFVGFKILKMTKHPEDGTIRCRWRIVGIPGYKVIFGFWQFFGKGLEKQIDEAQVWHDGFSVFSVDSEGLVYKVTADKMMPDDEKEQSKKSNILLKLGYLIGITNSAEEAFHCKNNSVN